MLLESLGCDDLKVLVLAMTTRSGLVLMLLVFVLLKPYRLMKHCRLLVDHFSAERCCCVPTCTRFRILDIQDFEKHTSCTLGRYDRTVSSFACMFGNLSVLAILMPILYAVYLFRVVMYSLSF